MNKTVYGMLKQIQIITRLCMHRLSQQANRSLILLLRYWYKHNLFPDLITVWIPLDKATRQNSCLQVSGKTKRTQNMLYFGVVKSDDSHSMKTQSFNLNFNLTISLPLSAVWTTFTCIISIDFREKRIERIIKFCLAVGIG